MQKSYIFLLFGTLFFLDVCDATFHSNSLPERCRNENKPFDFHRNLPNARRPFKGKRAPNGKKKPVNFSYNFQKLPLPSNNIGVMETLSDSDGKNKKDELTENTFSKTITDNSQKSSENLAIGDYDEIIEELKDMLKKTEKMEENFMRRRRDEDHKNAKKKKYNNYIDYSNSQMPFNEGQPVKQKVKVVPKQFPENKLESNNQKRNKRTGICPRKDRGGINRECKKRMTTSLHKGFPNLLRSKGENSETLSDGAEYLRVRRFLDQARRKRYKSVTLETKEAAMSRVLDPNLNVDGILEPHVRKRRGF